MKAVHTIDAHDDNAAIDEIVEKVANASPALLEGIRKTYDLKQKYNPSMPPFISWLRDVWATQVFIEANGYCGGYTLEKAKRIADIEYFGTPLVRSIKSENKDIEWAAYVEEGRVNLTLFVPTSTDLIEEIASDERIERIKDTMRKEGYDDAQAIYDYDEECVPVTGTRKFI